jgi:hypothetical protein
MAIQANNYSAELFRRATMGAFLQRGATIGSVTGGIVGATDLAVTYGGSGLNVSVAAGEVYINGSSSSVQSGYYLRNTTALSLTPAAANPSNPRIDLVYAAIQDAAYSGSNNQGVIAIATGTPTSGATLTNLSGAPSLGTSAYALAYVLIPANASSITNTDIGNVSLLMRSSFPDLVPVSKITSYTAVSGDYVIAGGLSPTITLPAPNVGVIVGVIADGTGVVTVTTPSGAIFGPGLGASGSPSALLGEIFQYVVVIGNGTNYIVSQGAQDSGWQSFSFVNSWAGSGANYRLTGNVLRFRGSVSGGSSGTTMATLPSAYRPATAAAIGATTFVSTFAAGSLAVTTGGLVQPSYVSGSLSFFQLDGLTCTID